VARAASLLLAGLILGPPVAAAEIPVVELDGIVHAVSAAHVVEGIAQAERTGAPAVIVRMDTPGGLDTAMRQIVDKVLASKVPVVAWVGPSGARAASAGFVILLAADVAAMAPGTNTGAAHPVSLGAQQDETMSKKAASDAAAYVRGKADRRGRSVELAEKAVTESRSFTEKEALAAPLIDLVAADLPALLLALEGREVRRFDGTTLRLQVAGHATRTVAMTWRQRVLSAIARPEVLFLLLLGALAGIGAEISHPGALFPGVLGATCLILFLFASQILPVSGAGILLVLLGVLLLIAEVKVASYGLLTVGGIAAIILGAMMLVDSGAPELKVPLTAILPGVAVLVAWTFLIVRLVLRAQRRRAVTGASGMIDTVAVADTDLDPEGWVRVMGERWRAVSDERVPAGDRVRVVEVQGLTLTVRRT
jgi:membrane-bound serine protease (ClpP class)